jgi:hypothetical protein
MQYISSIPTKLDQESMSKSEWVKQRTLELYEMLPMTSLEDRKACTEIRDEIITLNYPFFCYVAKLLYTDNTTATYEDKLQTVLTNFCVMWPEYRFPKINKYGEYKDYKNLSFTVFFRPRLIETSKRELNVIKYSLRRSICIKAANQLGKKWTELSRDDVAKVKLPPEEMKILERVFNNQYTKDIDMPENCSVMVSHQMDIDSIETLYNENYNSTVDLIIHEMIDQESKLSDSYLLKMSKIYTIPYDELIEARPIAESKLKKQLEDSMAINESFKAHNNDVNADSDDMDDGF